MTPEFGQALWQFAQFAFPLVLAAIVALVRLASRVTLLEQQLVHAQAALRDHDVTFGELSNKLNSMLITLGRMEERLESLSRRSG
jgi:hypothetical protein